MPRRGLKIRTWDDVIDHLMDINARHMVRKDSKSPYLCVKDKITKKQVSLRPLIHSNIDQVIKVEKLIEHLGNQDWNYSVPIEKQIQYLENPNLVIEKDSPIYSWEDIYRITNEHLNKTQKQSSAKNAKADLNNLKKLNVNINWPSIKNWVFQKPLETRPFKNRLDSLEQIRLALFNTNGNEPNFLQRSNLDLLREQHKNEVKKANKYQPNKEFGNIRGIPTKEEAETYFDSMPKEFELEKWCLAIQLCYGLRNHELFHIEKIKRNKDDSKDLEKWIYIPGAWRTKSKKQHYAFPLYSEWILKYGLLKKFDEMQKQLRSKASMIIKSSSDKTIDCDPKNPNDLGVCINNDYLGLWITRRLLKVLPPFYASIPNKKGLIDKKAIKQKITPYDLRHTYAIRLATDPRCKHIKEEEAAQSMGHDIKTHKKHYQYWITDEAEKQQIILKTSLPA